MYWQTNYIIIPSLYISMAMCVVYVFFSWHRRNVPGAYSFGALSFSILISLFGYTQSIINTNISAKLNWELLRMLGMIFTPTSWLCFIIQFTGHSWLNDKHHWMLLAIEPILTIILFLTNQYHGWLYQGVEQEIQGSFSILNFTFGPWYWANVCYSYALVFVGLFWLLYIRRNSTSIFRWQINIIWIASFLPWLGNIASVLNLPLSLITPIPIAITISGLLIAWGIFRYNLLDILPIAQKTLIERMLDGVIILNNEECIINLNPATRKIFNLPESFEIVGKSIQDTLPEISGLVRELNIKEQTRANMLLGKGNNRGYYEVRVISITSHQKNPHWKLVTLHDVTEHKVIEKKLRQRVVMDELIAQISTHFISCPLNKVESEIDNAIKKLGDFLETDHCFIIIVNGPESTIDEGYEWTSTGIKPQIENLIGQSLAEHKWTLTKLKKSETITIDRIADFPLKADAERLFYSKIAFRSILIVPLMMNNVIIGFLGAANERSERKWTAEESQLLRFAGEIFVNTLMRKRVEQTIKGLREIDQVILTARSPEAIAAATLQHLWTMIPYQHAGIGLFKKQEDEVDILAYTVQGTTIHTRSNLTLASSGIFKAIESGNIYVVDDLKSRKEIKPFEHVLINFKVSSFIILPLVVHSEIVGCLLMAGKTPNAFSPEDQEVASEVADMLAVGIQNARLQTETNENLTRLSHLNEVSRIISSTLDMDIILRDVVKLTVELVDADSGQLCLLNPENQEQANCHNFNLPENFCQEAILKRTGVFGEVMESDKPIVIDHYPLHQNAIKEIVDAGIQAYLGIPVVASGKTIGVLSLMHKDASKHFDHSDVTLAKSIGQQAGVAIQNAQFYQAERHRVREMEALSATIADTLAELDLSRLLRSVVERAVMLLNASGGELAIYEEDTRMLEILVSINLDKDYTGTRMALAEGGIAGKVAETLEPVIVYDYQNLEGHSPQYGNLGSINTISVPLIAREHLMGVISIHDINPNRRFDEEDLRLITLFGQQAALAMEKAMHFEAAQRRASEAETLRQAGSVVAAALHLDETINSILEQLAIVVPYDSASVQLLRDNELVIVGGRGFKELDKVIGIHFPVSGDNPNSLVLNMRRPHIIADAPAVYPAFRQEPHNHIRSWLGVPLISQDRPIGMLVIDSSKTNHFQVEHARLAAAFADQVAIALEKARLYEEAKNRAIEAETLREAGAVVAAALQQNKTIDNILKQLSLVVPFDSASVLLLRGDEMEVVGGRGFKDISSVLGQRFSIQGNEPTAMVYQQHQPIMLSDVSNFASFKHLYHNSLKSWLGLPLSYKNRIIGMLTLNSTKADHFTPEHIRLVTAFADQVAIALENARLFEEVQQLAITDSLTGLYNRRYLLQAGHAEMERALRYNRPLSMIMIDIDQFKLVNDNFGHTVGDRVLQAVAERCSSSLREVDILCRYGGEEFAILLPEADLNQALEAAERLRHQVTHKPIRINRNTLSITISLGVAEVINNKHHSLEDLIDLADSAMYVAKSSGRNCVMSIK